MLPPIERLIAAIPDGRGSALPATPREVAVAVRILADIVGVEPTYENLRGIQPRPDGGPVVGWVFCPHGGDSFGFVWNYEGDRSRKENDTVKILRIAAEVSQSAPVDHIAVPARRFWRANPPINEIGRIIFPWERADWTGAVPFPCPEV